MTGLPFANYQLEIYNAGLAGKLPDIPLTYEELEKLAREKLTPEAFDYVAGGAGMEAAMRANRDAFARWGIVPRMLRNVSSRELAICLFGTKIPAPVMLAPIGVLSIVHPDAELAVARAAAALGIPMLLSTLSSHSLEEVAAEIGSTPRWFQLYWPKDRDFTASLLQRAGKAGYGAIAVTLDSKLLGWRPRDLKRSYLPFLRGEGIANYLSDPVFQRALGKEPQEHGTDKIDATEAAIAHWADIFSNPKGTWDDLAFLRANTNLPIVLKGILHPDDARRAVDLGMDGIIVSNHGGRQVDSTIGALDALPKIVDVAGKLPVLFDSGIRCGADIFIALALGAKAVLVGRPYVYGLGVAGERGIIAVMRALLAEFDLTMALSGISRIEELTSDMLEETQR